MLSTDGVSLFKSSTKDLWPVYLSVLNLPPNMRMNAQNVVLAGLWYGSKKPPMQLLLKPIMEQLQRLYTIGVMIDTPHGPVTYRAKLELAVFDLPAKAAALCAKQFNGKHGCSVCLHPGEYYCRRRVYSPVQYTERTHAGVVAAGRLAEAKGEAVTGVKCVSPMFKTIDLVNSVPVDYMHAVLEGVTRDLLRRWFLPKHHSGAAYLGSKVKVIDKLLLRQQPPHELSRPPRSLEKHLKYLKASELRSWLIFYSLPLLLGQLLPLFFHHYALLVCSLHVLLQEHITPAQVDAAESMLQDFCQLLPELYGEESCTSNAHLLLHLPKYVRLWGPLWTHSAFGFESKNGILKRLIHSRGNVVPQLLFNIDVAYTLQLVHHKLAEHESDETMAFLNKSSKLAPRPNMAKIGEHAYIIGAFHVKTPTSEQSVALGSNVPIPCFYKLFLNGVAYHAATKTNHGKRDSTLCSFYRDDNKMHFGRIMLFVNTNTTLALVREFVQPRQSLLQQAGPPCRTTLALYKEVDLLSSFIAIVEERCDTPLLTVPVTSIQGKVVIVKNQDTTYVIKQPNHFEHH